MAFGSTLREFGRTPLGSESPQRDRERMERLWQDDQIRMRSGDIGLPVHMVARRRRERGAPAGAGLVVDGVVMTHYDPFWARYDAFLNEKEKRRPWWRTGMLGAASLADGAHCLPTHAYATADGLCHAEAGYSGKSPQAMAPSCDNGGVWMSETGTCDTSAAPAGYQGPQGPSSVTPHPENAVDAAHCMQNGGWWSDDPPGCHDAHEASQTAPQTMNTSQKAAVGLLGLYGLLGVGVLAFVGFGAYTIYQDRKEER